MRIPIIAGNWKMNKTIAEAVELVEAMKDPLAEIRGVDKVVCPTSVCLPAVREAIGKAEVLTRGHLKDVRFLAQLERQRSAVFREHEGLGVEVATLTVQALRLRCHGSVLGIHKQHFRLDRGRADDAGNGCHTLPAERELHF